MNMCNSPRFCHTPNMCKNLLIFHVLKKISKKYSQPFPIVIEPSKIAQIKHEQEIKFRLGMHSGVKDGQMIKNQFFGLYYLDGLFDSFPIK